MELISHDVLVIGGGLAGLKIKKAGRNVAILSKVEALKGDMFTSISVIWEGRR